MSASRRTANPHPPALFGLAAVFAAALFFTQPAVGEDRALLVGVGAYQVGQRLPGIAKDMAQMKQVAGLMGFTDAQTRVLLDSEATLAGITGLIRTWLIQGTGPRDRALFYFSGHGSQVKDQSGDETDGADEVLLPYDTALKNNTLANVLLDDAFANLLGRVRAGTTIVILDACHSGTATKGLFLMDDDMRPKYFYYEGMPRTKSGFAVEETSRRHNFIAISACRDDEKAIATKAGSVFTLSVATAVARAVQKGGGLTMGDLRDFSTRFIADKLKNQGRAHHPVITGDPALASVNLIKPGNRPPAASLYDRLVQMAAGAAYDVDISVNQARFKINDRLVITCRPKTSGYLNIININPRDKNAVVLFPNRLHPQNYVTAGTKVKIPGDNDSFTIRALPPPGETLVVVFHTEKRINAHEDGLGTMKDLFKTLSDKSFKGFGVEAKENPNKFGAGILKAFIVK